MRADARLLAYDGDIGMRDHAATTRNKARCMTQEDGTFRTLPLHVRRRKMLANIALANGTQNGIGKRMHSHIRIRMALQAHIVRHFNATQNDMISRLKGVNIKSLAHANIGQAINGSAQKLAVGLSDIVHRGELAVGRFPRNDANTQSSMLGHRCVIRQMAQTFSLRAPMCREDFGKAEALRRLRPPQ